MEKELVETNTHAKEDAEFFEKWRNNIKSIYGDIQVKNRTINILGTDYKIIYNNYDDYENFKKYEWCASCSSITKEIHICNMRTYPSLKDEDDRYINEFERINLRHEIIHAFLNESGLTDNSYSCEAWAKNEEMVDWISIQASKIFKVYKELGILEEV